MKIQRNGDLENYELSIKLDVAEAMLELLDKIETRLVEICRALDARG